jgi:hypothetical protein
MREDADPEFFPATGRLDESILSACIRSLIYDETNLTIE